MNIRQSNDLVVIWQYIFKHTKLLEILFIEINFTILVALKFNKVLSEICKLLRGKLILILLVLLFSSVGYIFRRNFINLFYLIPFDVYGFIIISLSYRFTNWPRTLQCFCLSQILILVSFSNGSSIDATQLSQGKQMLVSLRWLQFSMLSKFYF